MFGCRQAYQYMFVRWVCSMTAFGVLPCRGMYVKLYHAEVQGLYVHGRVFWWL
jgi:hypothetical protein